MSIETRLRETGPKGGGGGGSSNSGGLAGTGGLFAVYSTQTALPFSKVLSGGANVTLSTDATSIIISASTGAGTGTVNSGSAGFIAYYPSNGTTVDDSTISTSTGAGIVPLNFSTLTSQPISQVTGDFWTLDSAGKYIYHYISGTAFYTRLTHTDGSVSSTSAGLMGTGGFFVSWSSDTTMSNERVLTAGSSITLVTDATTIWINALTPGAGAANTTIGTGGFLQLPVQSAKLYPSTSAATIDAGTPVWRLLYSATTQQYGIWQFTLPYDYSGSPATQLIFSSGSSLSVAKSVQWIVDEWGFSNSMGNIYVDTFAGANQTTIALSAGYSAGLVQIITVPLAITTSFNAGNLIRLRVSSSAGAITGNQELIGLGLFYRSGTQTIASGSSGLQGTGGFVFGIYQPGSTSVANLDAISLTSAQYFRVGSGVTVSGRFTADPTSASTKTIFGLSLPIASAMTASDNLAGVAFSGNIAGMGAEICADQTNDRAQIFWISGDVTSQSWSYNFTYQVIP